MPSFSRTPAKDTDRTLRPAKLTATQYWSLHPGGANFLFADGSVRFIKEYVGFTIFKSLATRAGGEVLSSDQF